MPRDIEKWKKAKHNWYKNNKELTRERASSTRTKRKELINEIKKELGCMLCKETSYTCIDFHHIIPENKDGNINGLVNSKSMKTALKEIKKCIAVCANCHRKLHAGILSPINKEQLLNKIASLIDKYLKGTVV